MPILMPIDKYGSVSEIEEKLGKQAFRVRVINRRAPLTVIAPHGGHIEPGTSRLAAAIASRRYNLFDFQGLITPGAFDLHVTSTRFRHPRLTQLLDRSRAALSVHSMGRTGERTIWLGGLNQPLKQNVLRRLTDAGFHVNPDSPFFRGESPDNCVNLCAEHGVQLELSRELFDELFVQARFVPVAQLKLTTKFKQMVAVTRQATEEYLRGAA